jgi:hypothetical protein
MKFPGFIASLLLCAALNLPAAAQYYPYTTPTYSTMTDPNYTDPRVRFCHSSAQCVIFVPPCRAPVAVNSDALPALAAWKSATRYRFGCNVMKLNIYNRASCINNSCAIVDSYYDRLIRGDPNNPRYCESPSDCSVAVSPCGKKFAVNARNFDLKQAELDAEGPCTGVIDTRPVMEVHCDYGKCNVLLNNHARTGE